jgi:hypothetical protein
VVKGYPPWVKRYSTGSRIPAGFQQLPYEYMAYPEVGHTFECYPLGQGIPKGSSTTSWIIGLLQEWILEFERFRRTNGGPRSPSAHAWQVRLPPHRHVWTFSGAHVCRVSFKHLPQLLRSHIRSFRTLWQLFKIPPCPPKYVKVLGVGGVPNFCCWLKS